MGQWHYKFGIPFLIMPGLAINEAHPHADHAVSSNTAELLYDTLLHVCCIQEPQSSQDGT
jgi:hypothetical protein